MNKTLLITLACSILIFLLFFVGVGIRILLVKGGEFKGTCSSNNPMLNKEGEACSLCGAMPDEQCKKDDDIEPKTAADLPKINA